MPILQIKDENGNFIPIPAIRGDDGKSAYEQAKDGGYTGTEEEFIQILGTLGNVNAVQLADMGNTCEEHISDKNNPHNVTAKQTGAIPEAYSASDDLNNELQSGGNKMTVCCYHSGTLNTPYKEGTTVFAHGMVITNANSASYGTQLCMPSGSSEIFVRSLSGTGITQWVKAVDTEWRNNMYHEVYNNIKPSLEGNIKIAMGSYKGTNTYGTNNPNTLTFEFVPRFVIVCKRGTSNIQSGGTFIWIRPSTTLNFINNGSTYWCYPSLNDKTFSWYNTESSAYQLNSSNYEYDYMAWG